MSESDPDPTLSKTEPENPGQINMFGDAKTGTSPSYQVLARKYRPANFSDLIGQQPMVHTLTNAFASGRIAHAFMLTGVRGVGKTTTARLLARALNYQSEKHNTPWMDLDPPGQHCAEISASRHMDVMEMDAASHTGIGDIREILDGVRYAPVSARYKVYIIDEVHMLSKPAFNALLKTLEEPPPHAIFILATTEIRKVPVTILSRCQRFDLARVGADQMVKHLANICQKESREVSKEGLMLIARASEGSVRDALSILDQALVQSESQQPVSPEEIRVMLGLADRSRVLNLFALAMKADAPAALAELQEQYDLGADPVVIAADLLDHCHQITRARALGEAADLSDYGPGAQQVRQLAETLSMGQLSRSWQMLLKAVGEIRIAPDPLAAAEMALIRLCVAAGLPSPEAAAKRVLEPQTTGFTPVKQTKPSKPVLPKAGNHPSNAPALNVQAVPIENHQTQAIAAASAASQPQTFGGLLKFLEAEKELHLLSQIEQYVRLVSYQPGAISFAPETDAPTNLAADLSKQLQSVTGQRWLINSDSKADGDMTIAQARREANAQDKKNVLADPSVQAVIKAFPEAKLLRVFDPSKGEKP